MGIGSLMTLSRMELSEVVFRAFRFLFACGLSFSSVSFPSSVFFFPPNIVLSLSLTLWVLSLSVLLVFTSVEFSGFTSLVAHSLISFLGS